jgi:hypothetical protein
VTTTACHFADRLITRVRRLGYPLCVGLDPHLPLIPPLFRRGTMSATDPQTAAAVEEFLLTALDRIADRVAIVKPQSAFFEQLGWRGVQVLEHVMTAAHIRGVQVLLCRTGRWKAASSARRAAFCFRRTVQRTMRAGGNTQSTPRWSGRSAS